MPQFASKISITSFETCSSHCLISTVFIMQTLNLQCKFYNALLPPANEVWGKVIFSEACAKNSVHGGATWAGTHPGTRYTFPPGPGTPPLVGPGTPPGTRYIPQDQVHSLDQVHPPTRYIPQEQVHPPEQYMLGDTGNKQAVRILLECILVTDCKGKVMF